jgi:transcriptional regulator
MYRFSYYTEEDKSKVIEFMKANSFAVITGAGEKYPVATHIPLEVEEVDGKVILSGHMMKKTDHHLAFEKDPNVMVIFNGPHTQVSANWYTNPAGGSTWNYMTVHAKGKVRFKDEAGTRKAVEDITNKYIGFNTAASFDKLSEEYISKMVKAILGFTIEVEELENVFKLSQEKDHETKLNVIEQLRKRGDENSVAIANEIEKRI